MRERKKKKSLDYNILFLILLTAVIDYSCFFFTSQQKPDDLRKIKQKYLEINIHLK